MFVCSMKFVDSSPRIHVRPWICVFTTRTSRFIINNIIDNGQSCGKNEKYHFFFLSEYPYHSLLTNLIHSSRSQYIYSIQLYYFTRF